METFICRYAFHDHRNRNKKDPHGGRKHLLLVSSDRFQKDRNKKEPQRGRKLILNFSYVYVLIVVSIEIKKIPIGDGNCVQWCFTIGLNHRNKKDPRRGRKLFWCFLRYFTRNYNRNKKGPQRGRKQTLASSKPTFLQYRNKEEPQRGRKRAVESSNHRIPYR